MTKFRKNHEVGKTISLKTIIQIVFSIAIILTFFIVPFLHNIINDIVAQIAWYFSFAYIIFTSIETRIKTEKPIFENEYFEFIYNWGERFLLFLIVIEFLIGVGMSVYLIYIIPNENLKEIVLTIVAALFGGFLTLVGVAWTFKKSDEDRYENFRKQAKPFIGVISDMSAKAAVAYNNPIHFCKKEHGDSLKMKLHCHLQNSDKCIFYFDKVRVDEIDYYPDASMFINKNEVFSIFVMEELQWEPKDKTIQIFVTDVNYEQRIFEISPGTESNYGKIVEVIFT